MRENAVIIKYFIFSSVLQLRITHYTSVDVENFTPNMMVIKSRKMRSVGHVTCM
jgi:hypothetical protein